MKRLFALLVLGLFTASIVGCEARGRVGDPDDRDSVRRRTTVHDRDGEIRRTETKTEIRRD